MSDLYDTDTFAWAREQVDLLRRLAAGERVNDQIDWANIIEEVETVGRSEVRAVTAALINAMQHKLCLIGWPAEDAQRHWQHEVRVHLAEAVNDFRKSMRKEIEAGMATLYRRAVLAAGRDMAGAPPATPALPATCPWTLDDLLAEGRTALRPAG
jgi:hypothetical protein